MATDARAAHAPPLLQQAAGNVVSFDSRQPATSDLAPQRATPAGGSPAGAAQQQPVDIPYLPLIDRSSRSSSRLFSYRPAVLRPTERPFRQLPLTPPQSSSNSYDSRRCGGGGCGGGCGGADSPPSLSRQSTADSFTYDKALPTSDTESEWMAGYNYSRVTAPPTRDHWKPDSSATACEAAVCQKPFTLFQRRHHCRRCGHVFCHTHSPFSVPLDQRARFHPDGVPSRACDYCWSEYKGWQSARTSRASSVAGSPRSSDSLHTPTMMSINVTAAAASSSGALPGRQDHDSRQALSSSLAGSVPRDWAWSTF